MFLTLSEGMGYVGLSNCGRLSGIPRNNGQNNNNKQRQSSSAQKPGCLARGHHWIRTLGDYSQTRFLSQ